MMKFILMMMFMIPLNFFKEKLMQYMYFMMFFIFLIMSMSYNYIYINISYNMGVDMLSYLMNLLSIWICSLMIMSSQSIFNKKYYFNLFLLLILMMMFFLFCTFSSLNLFIFYLMFEITLIPMLILVLGWGYQPERLQAGIYLMFYTMFMSLPMMISIFYCYKKFNSLMFFELDGLLMSFYMYLLMNMIFFVKIPMYFVHLWLPKAHVEAPVAGSMILAGIMLKLGGYGLIRLMSLFLIIGKSINLYFIILSLIGGVIISLICLRQTDMKSLVAYSSVAHMGLCMSGILTLNYWGVSGSLMMMIAHGLCSSGLFCLVNLSYERLLSRSLYLNKGLITLIPSLSLWWFLFCSSNMAAPPSLNLLSEILLINSLVSFNINCMMSLMILSFFSAGYSLYLFSYSQHGKINFSIYSFKMIEIREFLLLLLHWLPLNMLILKSDFL
uniref:NADH-ubiquinone oxidoreductase chain 4 n=1 Tax=Pselaphinae sp. 10 EF-2015 TaxID=1756854 RepID=A0A0S2M8T7_9COLE|nr:NADH deshydrogenase subunit 4 [Pselaphinae sp. 10 EF-2015]